MDFFGDGYAGPSLPSAVAKRFKNNAKNPNANFLQGSVFGFLACQRAKQFTFAESLVGDAKSPSHTTGVQNVY